VPQSPESKQAAIPLDPELVNLYSDSGLSDSFSYTGYDALVKNIQMAKIKIPPIPYNMARRSYFSDKKSYM
jgi:hypothetical protein